MTERLEAEPSAAQLQLLSEEAAALNEENPWPGLAPYTEVQKAFFFGRASDSAGLFRFVKRKSLTILHGRSGLGKSSLLQAGLFPLLRQEDGLPVYLNFRRLDYSPGAAPLAQQVLGALVKAAQDEKIEAPPIRPSDTLWEYFHRAGAEFWSSDNRIVTPVLVFDQFEELLILGHMGVAGHDRMTAFVEELADLVLENRVPEKVRRALEEKPDKADEYVFRAVPCRVVISLREDYLADLEDLKPTLRDSISLYNRVRLLPMNGRQAMEILLRPAGELVTEPVATAIVKFVAAGSTSADSAAPAADPASLESPPVPPANDSAAGECKDPLQILKIEPALLSVVCHELNKSRQALGLKQITTKLLEGSSKSILSNFYDRSVADLPPVVKEFIEDELVTLNGKRNFVPLDNAPPEFKEALRKLVDSRLVCLDIDDRGQWLELTHDRLTDPIIASRDERNRRVAERQARRAASARRVQRIVYALLIAGLLVFASVLFWNHRLSVAEKNLKIATVSLTSANAQLQQTEQELSTRLELYFGLRIKDAIAQPIPQTGLAELLMNTAERKIAEVKGNTQDMHLDVISLLLPPAPFVPERMMIPPSGPQAAQDTQIDYSPDARFFVTLRNGALAIFDAGTGKQLDRYRATDVKSFAFPRRDPSDAGKPNHTWLGIRTSEDAIVFWNLESDTIQRTVHLQWTSTAAVKKGNPSLAPRDARDPSAKNPGPAVPPSPKEAASSGSANLPFIFSSGGDSIIAAGITGLGQFPVAGVFANDAPTDQRLGGGAATQPADESDRLASILGDQIVVSSSPSGLTYYRLIGNQLTALQSPSSDQSQNSQANHAAGANSKQPVYLATASLDGRSLCTTNSGSVIVETFAPQWAPTSVNFDSQPLFKYDASSIPTCCAFSSDGKLIAVGTVKNEILIFSRDGRIIQSLKQPGRVAAIAFRPDGLELASASEQGKIMFWNLRPREKAEEDDAYLMGAGAKTVAVSPDGQRIARLLPSIPAQLGVYDAATGKLVWSSASPIRSRDNHCDVALTNDGHIIAANASGIWDVQGNVMLPIKMPAGESPLAIRLKDDGSQVAFLRPSGEWYVKDTSTGRTVIAGSATRPSQESAPESPQDACLAIAHDGSRLAVYWPNESKIHLFRISDASPADPSTVDVPGHGAITCLEFSGDDSCILCLRSDASLLALDIRQRRPILELSPPGGADESGLDADQQSKVGAIADLQRFLLNMGPSDGPLDTYSSAHLRMLNRDLEQALHRRGQQSPQYLSVSRDDRLLVRDVPSADSIMVRGDRAAETQIKIGSGMQLDENDLQVSYDNAKSDLGGRPQPAAPAVADFWNAWWYSQQLLSNLELDPSASPGRDTLDIAYTPLKQYGPRVGGDIPAAAEIGRERLLAVSRLSDSAGVAQFEQQLAGASTSPPRQQKILLDEIRDRLMVLLQKEPADSPQRTQYGALLAADYAMSMLGSSPDIVRGQFRQHTDSVNAVAFSHDGNSIVSGSDDKSVKLWDAKSTRQLAEFTGNSLAVNCVAISRDGNYVLAGSSDNSLKLWDATTGKLLFTFSGHTDNVNAAAFSDDASLAVSGSSDNSIRLWNCKTGESVQTFTGHTASVTSVAFSPDGKFIASGSADNSIRLWNLNTGESTVFSGHGDTVNSVAFSPDGKYIVSGSTDKTIKLWDVSTGRELRTFRGHTDAVNSVAFSRDGEAIASASADKTLRLWDVNSGALLAVLTGHTGPVNSVAFDPADPNTIVSGSSDNTCIVWNLDSARKLLANVLDSAQAAHDFTDWPALRPAFAAIPPDLLPVDMLTDEELANRAYDDVEGSDDRTDDVEACVHRVEPGRLVSWQPEVKLGIACSMIDQEKDRAQTIFKDVLQRFGPGLSDPSIPKDQMPAILLSDDDLADRAYQTPSGDVANECLKLIHEDKLTSWESFVKAAVAYDEIGEHKQAIGLYTDCLSARSNDPRFDRTPHALVYSQIGKAYGNWDWPSHSKEAYAALSQAQALDDAYSSTYSIRAELEMRDQNYSAALDDYKLQSEHDSGTDGPIGQAAALFALGRSTDAIAVLRQMLVDHSDDADAWSAAAESLRQSELWSCYPIASKCYGKAIELIGDNGDSKRLVFCYSHRASVERAMGRLDDADKNCVKAIGLDPNDPWSVTETGMLELAEGYPDRAVDHLKTALSLSEQDDRALSQLARAYLRLDPPDQETALTTWADAIKLNPAVNAERGKYFLDQGQSNLREAQRDFLACIDAQKQITYCDCSLGIIADMRGQGDVSAWWFKKVLADSASNASAQDHRECALAEAYLGDAGKAMSEWSEAARLDPDAPANLLLRAEIDAIEAKNAGPKDAGAKVASALADLVPYLKSGPTDWYDLAHDSPLESLQGNAQFEHLIVALRKPLNDPAHAQGLADFERSDMPAPATQPAVTPATAPNSARASAQ